MWLKNVLNEVRKRRLKAKKNEKRTYERAPLCKFSFINCKFKKKMGNGPVKCFYKLAPKRCCFQLQKGQNEEEEPTDTLYLLKYR